MSDLIEREAAISYAISGERRREDGEDWIRTREVRQSLLDMPSAQPEVLACGEGELSAQPEIIRCKDCKLHGTNGYRLNCAMFCCTMPDAGFCSCGERRTDEM